MEKRDRNWRSSWVPLVMAGAAASSQRGVQTVELSPAGLRGARRRARERASERLLDVHGTQACSALMFFPTPCQVIPCSSLGGSQSTPFGLYWFIVVCLMVGVPYVFSKLSSLVAGDLSLEQPDL